MALAPRRGRAVPHRGRAPSPPRPPTQFDRHSSPLVAMRAVEDYRNYSPSFGGPGSTVPRRRRVGSDSPSVHTRRGAKGNWTRKRRATCDACDERVSLVSCVSLSGSASQASSPEDVATGAGLEAALVQARGAPSRQRHAYNRSDRHRSISSPGATLVAAAADEGGAARRAWCDASAPQ